MSKKIKSAVLLLSVFVFAQCAKRAPELPKELLGIGIGMNREDANRRLLEIAKHQRDEPKRQEIWLLNNDPRFGYLVVGYNENDKIRFVMATAKPKGGQPVRYADIGDINRAKLESAGSFHRYIWESPARGNLPAYYVIAQGNNAEILSLYTLTDSLTSAEKPGEDEDESGER